MKEARYSVSALAVVGLKGLAMGAAEVVPGVSGGTIALITGIYEELVNAISAFRPALWRVLRSEGPGAAWRACHGTFLGVLGAGMAVSVLFLARAITHLLGHHPIQLWAFFLGLIVASVGALVRAVGRWDALTVGLAGAGIGLGFVLTLPLPWTAVASYPYLFLAGAVAICAWILPGISGSFVLLLFGLYDEVMSAMRSLDLAPLAVFAAGGVVGLATFARLVAWAFHTYRGPTLAFFTGVMLGAINRLWPWRVTDVYQYQTTGEAVPVLQTPVLPHMFEAMTGQDPHLGAALALTLAGMVLVILVQRLRGTPPSER